jgi:hypothetical protein
MCHPPQARNTAGLSADDIFNEVNNTVKADLITATNAVVIDILDESFPPATSPQARTPLRTVAGRHGAGRHLEGADRAMELAIVDLLGKDSATEIMVAYQRNILDVAPVFRSDNRLLHHSRRRHLVFFSEEYPATINAVLDQPFCLTVDPLEQCALVSSQACVVLEEGDDEEFISMVLIAGLRDAINNGFS